MQNNKKNLQTLKMCN